MGNQQNNRPSRKKKSSGKSALTLKSKDDALYLPYMVPADAWAELLAVALTHGCYIGFFTTRDRGAFGVKVMHDDLEEFKLWFKDESEFSEIAQAITDALKHDD